VKKPTSPPPPPKPDPTADALIQHGFAHNAGLLDMNGSLQTRDIELAYPWHLPSRLFQFPIEVSRQLEDGTRTISLRHPLLAEHPLVRHVEEKLGAGKWRDLLKTAQFTTPECIASAVTYGLQYSHHEGKRRNGYISTTEAREIMGAVEAPEPADWRGIIRQHFSEPSPCKSEKGVASWPINTWTTDRFATTWGMILAIEAGWFAHDRAGFLRWTNPGRELFPPVKRAAAPEPKARQPEPEPQPTLADELGPRPATKPKAQFDLF
jgi:hypothetical protein